MNKCGKKIAIIIFFLGIFATFGNTVEAGFPTIFYARGSTSTTDSIVVETSINPNNYGTTAWVEYGTSDNLINFQETNHVLVGSSGHASNFIINVINLSSDTTYYLRVAANNGQNTVKSNIIALQTLPSLNPPQDEIVNQTENKVVYTTAQNEATNTTNSTAENTTEKINETQNTNSPLGANVFSSFNFLPNTLPNLIALIVLILTILVLFRKVYVDKKTY